MDDQHPYPLYRSTLHLFRLSPLHHGSAALLKETTLNLHARRLRDLLRGDTVRGVQIGAGDTTLTGAGPFKGCVWDLIGDEAAWATAHDGAEDLDQDDLRPNTHPIALSDARGVYIQCQYAKQTYTALLLRDPANITPTPPEFSSLPLLLMRMPNALKETVLKYLSDTFDTRIAPFQLSSSFLTSTVESLLSHLEQNSSVQTIADITKGVQLQLAFPTVTSLLKTIDVSISRNDISGFLHSGKPLLKEPANASLGPFTAALSTYTTAHLSLTLTHPAVQISRVSCALFNISADGKLKLFSAPPLPSSTSISSDEDATVLSPAQEWLQQVFYAALVKQADSRAGFELPVLPSGPLISEKRTTKRATPALSEPSKNTKKRKGQAKSRSTLIDDPPDPPRVRDAGSIPAEPPPPYELHDPRESFTGAAGS